MIALRTVTIDGVEYVATEDVVTAIRAVAAKLPKDMVGRVVPAVESLAEAFEESFADLGDTPFQN